MSDKLSEQLCMIAEALRTTNPLRGRRIEHIAKKVAALEQQLVAKDAEIARLRLALQPFVPSAEEVRIIKDLGRDDGKPRMQAYLLNRAITDHELISAHAALAETSAAPLTALALPEDDVPDAAPEVK